MTPFLKWLAIPYIIIIEFQISSSEGTCPSGATIGSTNTMEYEAEDNDFDRRLYLNAANPAPCNGSVVSWTYCYYSPREPAGVYEASFAIFRLTNIRGIDLYLKPQRSPVFTISINGRSDLNGFTCTTFNPEQNVTIREGDIIGVCLRGVEEEEEEEEESELTLVSRTLDAQDRLIFADCGNGVPRFVIERSVSIIRNRLLHLSAEIISNSNQAVNVSSSNFSTVSSITTTTSSAITTSSSAGNVSSPNFSTVSSITTTSSYASTTSSSAGNELSSNSNKSISTTTIKIIGCVVGANLVLFLTAIVFCCTLCYCVRRRKQNRCDDEFDTDEERRDNGYSNFHYLSHSTNENQDNMYASLRLESPRGSESSPDSNGHIVTRRNLDYNNPLFVEMSPNVAYNRNDFRSAESNEYAYILTDLMTN